MTHARTKEISVGDPEIVLSAILKAKFEDGNRWISFSPQIAQLCDSLFDPRSLSERDKGYRRQLYESISIGFRSTMTKYFGDEYPNNIGQEGINSFKRRYFAPYACLVDEFD